MWKHRTSPRSAHLGGAVRAAVAPVLIALSLILMPSITMAQAPSPEEALDAVAEYVRDQTWVVGDWQLGVDAVRAARVHPEAVVDPITHRGILSRVAEARELPFYAGEDFGRVVCDASPDPERPAVDCRFSHGTSSLLMLTVVSSDRERGVTRVHAFSGPLSEPARWYDNELRVGFNTHSIVLEVEYDSSGVARVNPEGAVAILRQGFKTVDEVRGAPPRQ
jgi:hypothetical protein